MILGEHNFWQLVRKSREQRAWKVWGCLALLSILSGRRAAGTCVRFFCYRSQKRRFFVRTIRFVLPPPDAPMLGAVSE